jgi:predicted metal-dependent phosphotriesterase family hydrolase
MNPNITRRQFISSSTLAAVALTMPKGLLAKAEYADITNTVNGPMDTSKMGFTLTHEHVLADFGGAATWSKERYDASEVFKVALPHLKALKETGCSTFIDCSPNYLGRDVMLLKKLADATGLNIITNTGYYGAVQERFIPKHAFTETAEQIAARWIAEFKNGIEGTGIKPGFIKTSTDTSPLTNAQKKLITAAALTHLETGLTMLVHTGNGAAAKEQLAILKEVGVDNSARVWTHAQNEKDEQQFIEAATQNCWVSFDGLNPETIEANLRYLAVMKEANLLDHVLVSHDSGWYNVGEPSGGNYKGYTCIATQFIPKMKEKGFTEKEIDLLFKSNPAKAFAIKVRKR